MDQESNRLGDADTSRRDFLKVTLGGAALALDPGLFVPPRLNSVVEVALIGCGRQGRAILAELTKIEAVKVAAICDSDKSRLRSARRRARGAKAYPSMTELLKSEKSITAVIVATPTHLHTAPALAALEAGKHVYCEAPMAHRAEDCARMAKAARSSGKVFHVGYLARSNPIYGLARSFVRAGAIRDVHSMRAQTHRKTSWRAAASEPERRKRLDWRMDKDLSLGLLGEFGTHQFDVAHWMLGAYPDSVRASGSVLIWDDGREVPDCVRAELTFSGGRVMTYEATLGNSFDGVHELFFGSMGSVKLAWTAGWMFKEADAETQGWEVYANRQRFHNEEGITLIADATKLAKQGKLKEGVGLPNPPLFYGLSDFLSSVGTGSPVIVSAEEGMRTTIVGIAANEALRSGKTVPLDAARFKAQK